MHWPETGHMRGCVRRVGGMPKVISLCALKGGANKTSIAIQLAGYYSMHGRSTLLVDCDPQGSAMRWAQSASDDCDVAVCAMRSPQLERDLPKLSQQFDRVILDTAGRVDEESRGAMICSDLVLIPVLPSPADMWTLPRVFDAVEAAKTIKPTLKVAMVLSRFQAGTALGRLVQGHLKDYPAPLIGQIGQRVAIPESMLNGSHVSQYQPHSKAAAEVAALVDSIERMIDGEAVRRKQPEHVTAG